MEQGMRYWLGDNEGNRAVSGTISAFEIFAAYLADKLHTHPQLTNNNTNWLFAKMGVNRGLKKLGKTPAFLNPTCFPWLGNHTIRAQRMTKCKLQDD